MLVQAELTAHLQHCAKQPTLTMQPISLGLQHRLLCLFGSASCVKEGRIPSEQPGVLDIASRKKGLKGGPTLSRKPLTRMPFSASTRLASTFIRSLSGSLNTPADQPSAFYMPFCRFLSLKLDIPCSVEWHLHH